MKNILRNIMKIFHLSPLPSRWYSLTCKPGQNKSGYRGELEVKIGFTVRAQDTASVSGSVSELNKKARGSISSLNKVAGNIGGSLLSLGGKEKKNLARLASAVSGSTEVSEWAPQ